MKKTIFSSLSVILIIGIQSCGKKKGSFTTDKSTYTQRELITVSNTTVKESTYYKWSFGGTEIVGKNPSFTIPDNTPAGSFEIKVLPTNNLSTTSNFKEHSEFVTIVDAEEGVLTFWKLKNNNFTKGNIQITINGQTKTISQEYSSSPTCGESGSGCAIFTGLKKGKYEYTAVGSNLNIGGNVTISKPFDCVKVLIE